MCYRQFFLHGHIFYMVVTAISRAQEQEQHTRKIQPIHHKESSTHSNKQGVPHSVYTTHMYAQHHNALNRVCLPKHTRLRTQCDTLCCNTHTQHTDTKSSLVKACSMINHVTSQRPVNAYTIPDHDESHEQTTHERGAPLGGGRGAHLVWFGGAGGACAHWLQP